MQCRRPGLDSLGLEDGLEEGMATHSSILAWRILCTKEPDRAPVHGVTELDMTVRLTHKHITFSDLYCAIIIFSDLYYKLSVIFNISVYALFCVSLFCFSKSFL